MDEMTERLIKAGLQPSSPAPGGGPTITIPINKPDGTQEQVPVEVAQFMALDQVLLELKQIGLRLDGLHHHMAAREHARSQVHKTCPVCVAIEKAREMALEQVMRKAEEEAAETLGQEQEEDGSNEGE